MELLNPLRLLARRRRVVAVGAILSVLLGIAASGYVPVGPFASPERHAAVATAQIQIDTARPLAADVRANTAAIADQAVLLGERLASDDARSLIASRADVPLEDLAVLSSRTAIVGRASPLARAAVDASASVQTPVRLTVTTAGDTPIISLVAAAPDRETASRLASAAAPALRFVIASGATVKKQLEVKPLARPRTAAVVSGGPRPLIGVLVALFGFAGWCCCAVILGGLGRAWRKAGDGLADPLGWPR